jgi:hypothetical protein
MCQQDFLKSGESARPQQTERLPNFAYGSLDSDTKGL